MEKPNIILICADQWRSDCISYNGCEAAINPNLDNLAADGVAFTNAFCQNPVCVPSRSSFLTGWYPHTKGYRTMHHLMKDDEPNLLKEMKNNGYYVYWGSRNDFLHESGDVSLYCDTRGTALGNWFKDLFTNKEKMSEASAKIAKVRGEPGSNMYYSHFRGVSTDQINRGDRIEMEEVIDFINKKKMDQPLFMFLNFNLPHPPYDALEKYYQQIDPELITKPIRLTSQQLANRPSIMKGIRANQKMYEWSDEKLKDLKRVYLAMCSELDSYIGNLVATLKAKGIYDNTLIFFFSDHGDYTGDYEIAEKNQNTFEDCLTKVPLIIKPTTTMQVKKRKTDALTELIDIQATIYDVTKIKPNHTHFGNSLIDVLSGNDLNRDVVFCEGGRLKSDGQHAMDAGHKPENEYWARTTEQEKMPQHTKATMIRDHNFKYVYRLYEKDEFYDLVNDPLEKTNLIDDPKHALTIQNMKNRMLQHFFETGDVVAHRYDKRT